MLRRATARSAAPARRRSAGRPAGRGRRRPGARSRRSRKVRRSSGALPSGTSASVRVSLIAPRSGRSRAASARSPLLDEREHRPSASTRASSTSTFAVAPAGSAADEVEQHGRGERVRLAADVAADDHDRADLGQRRAAAPRSPPRSRRRAPRAAPARARREARGAERARLVEQARRAAPATAAAVSATTIGSASSVWAMITAGQRVDPAPAARAATPAAARARGRRRARPAAARARRWRHHDADRRPRVLASPSQTPSGSPTASASAVDSSASRNVRQIVDQQRRVAAEDAVDRLREHLEHELHRLPLLRTAHAAVEPQPHGLALAPARGTAPRTCTVAALRRATSHSTPSSSGMRRRDRPASGPPARPARPAPDAGSARRRPPRAPRRVKPRNVGDRARSAGARAPARGGPVRGEPAVEQDQQAVGERPRLGAVVQHDAASRGRGSRRTDAASCSSAARVGASRPANGSSSSSASASQRDRAGEVHAPRLAAGQLVRAGARRARSTCRRSSAASRACAAARRAGRPTSRAPPRRSRARERRASAGACSAAATRPCALERARRPASAARRASRSSVDLPAPLGPSTATSSPRRSSRSMPESTSTRPSAADGERRRRQDRTGSHRGCAVRAGSSSARRRRSRNRPSMTVP